MRQRLIIALLSNFPSKELQKRMMACCLEEIRHHEREQQIKVDKMEAINPGSTFFTKWKILCGFFFKH